MFTEWLLYIKLSNNVMSHIGSSKLYLAAPYNVKCVQKIKHHAIDLFEVTKLSAQLLRTHVDVISSKQCSRRYNMSIIWANVKVSLTHKQRLFGDYLENVWRMKFACILQNVSCSLRVMCISFIHSPSFSTTLLLSHSPAKF